MGIPKYIYTPNRDRAFLQVTADIYGNWSAGFIVWGQTFENGTQLVGTYGPYVNDCQDMDSAIIQLANAYEVWKEEQDGLLRR